jgi:hypothetical protein
MKQIEIDCVKGFVEKMQSFGYGFKVSFDESPDVNVPLEFNTKIKLEGWKRLEKGEALPWANLSLSYRPDNHQIQGGTEL